MRAYEKHGQAGRNWTPTYRSWHSMIQRCCNPNFPPFKYYGGRGIGICQSWRYSFTTFFKDMGERPEGRTLDRVNNNGHYCKANCRWATPTEQQSNTRQSRILTFHRKHHTMKEWSRIVGIAYGTIKNRQRRGWSTARTLTSAVVSRSG